MGTVQGTVQLANVPEASELQENSVKRAAGSDVLRPVVVPHLPDVSEMWSHQRDRPEGPP